MLPDAVLTPALLNTTYDTTDLGATLLLGSHQVFALLPFSSTKRAPARFLLLATISFIFSRHILVRSLGFSLNLVLSPPTPG